uniref:Uncharacterized protein n=1 Tax=Octopus bimaculoides TaxID=37653 RepID=A0A0L8GPP7_OCTBM
MKEQNKTKQQQQQKTSEMVEFILLKAYELGLKITTCYNDLLLHTIVTHVMISSSFTLTNLRSHRYCFSSPDKKKEKLFISIE